MVHLHNKEFSFNTITKRYFDPGTAMLISAGISAGGGLLGGLLGKKKSYSPEDYLVYKQLPDYPESETARKDWASTLQDWGKEEGYGAIPMNWDEIWQSAKDKISRYYWGGVNDPGLAGKMKASAARRNMPVNEQMLASLGFQEAIDLGELATTQASQKAEYGEKGRNTWLSSMMNLAGLKPQFVTGTGAVGGSTSYGAGNMISDVSSGISSLFSQYAQGKMQEDFLTKLFSQYSGGIGGGMPTSSQSSLFNISDLVNTQDLTKNFPGFTGTLRTY